MSNARELAELGGSYGTGGFVGMKNRIINGAMVIDQRNAGASGTAVGYTIDRWSFASSLSTKGTWQQNAGSVTPPAGFAKYLGFTSNSAYSVSATDYFVFRQPIEGFNFYDFDFGKASAKAVTVSFWVRSSLTGTFCVNFSNSDGTRCYPATYTINAANTWEQKSVTVPGDTSGTWATGATNGVGVYLDFAMGVGSTYSGTANTWTSSLVLSATGATSVVGTNGATFYITGVQLEKGSTATSFDYRPYGTELALCQRYFEKTYNTTTAVGTNTGANTGPSGIYVQNTSSYNTVYNSFCVEKRSAPTVTLYDPWNGTVGQWRYGIGVVGDTTTSSIGATSNSRGLFVQTAGVSISISSVFYGHWTASAEL